MDEKIQTKRKGLRAVESFLRIALRDFSHIASLFPSSSFATRAVVKQLPADGRIFYEYGPGNGVITRKILEKIHPEASLTCVELNSEFIPYLQKIGDPRLNILTGDVRKISSEIRSRHPEGIDAVVSGIPFSFLSAEIGREIFANTRRALKPGGKFILYQNSLRTMGLLKEHFGDVKFTFEPRNVFPYFILVGTVPH